MAIMPGVIALETASTEEILAALKQGAMAVTANKRLALSIRREYDSWAIAEGLAAWPTPDILPWSTWLERALDDARLPGAPESDGPLLTPDQEWHIWEEIILADLVDQPLLQTTGAIKQAIEAWRLLHAWRLPLDRNSFLYNKDSTRFFAWASEYRSRCRKNHWLSPACAAECLEEAIQARNVPLPRSLLILGFEEFSPQQDHLLKALRTAGCQIRILQRQTGPALSRRVSCADHRAEVKILARWLRSRLEQEPGTAIGVVVPDLAARRTSLRLHLDELLAPSAQFPGRWWSGRPYNISLGLPLSDEPLITVAFMVLRMTLSETITLEDAGKLLLSPFFTGWQQEAGARAMLDACLRETGEGRIRLVALLQHARQQDQTYACPILARQLERWRGAVREIPRRAGAEVWAAHITRLLQAVGWAGGRTLSSEEYQAALAWRELLVDFGALRRVSGTLSLPEAVCRLERLGAERIFQPQGPAAPVQVLGLLEATDLVFDHLWIMDLHDGQWPPAPHPNPFLPLPMQRRAGLPHASESRELELAKAITRRLLRAAPDVIASHPLREGDEALSPSPLITDLPEIPLEALDQSDLRTWRETVAEHAEFEELTADPAPPLAQTAVRGGSSVFRLQAACPFRAFAELRLGARPLEQAGMGLDPRTRGTAVHKILELIWRRLESHARLQELSPLALETLVEDCVNQVLDELVRRFPHTLGPHLRKLESGRLLRNMLDWLALERQRQPFRVVERESRQTVAAGGIEVQLTIDRIDELPDGRKILFDYKTGKLAPAQWFGERPEEPQLPVYSMAVPGELTAVAFGQIQTRNMAFHGIAAEEGLMPSVPSWDNAKPTQHAGSWENVLGEWRTTITNLGTAFREGAAQVDPKKFPGTCRYCELTSLCRVHEALAGRRLPEENGAENE